MSANSTNSSKGTKGSKGSKQLAEEFDQWSPQQMQNPYEMFKTFRSQCPVGHTNMHGGFYFAASYEAAKRVYQDYATFSSSSGVGIPNHPYKVLPLDLDPPLQTKFRQILNKRFTVAEIAKKRSDIEQTVNRLIDCFIERGSADLASEVIRPMMPTIVLPILGVPMEDCDKVQGWIDHLTHSRATDAEGIQNTGIQMAQYLMGLAASRRGEPANESDVVGLLLASCINGKPFSDEEVYCVLLNILFGGLDTTSSVMLEALLYLSRNPEEKRKLEAGEYDWAMAIEELVRMASPIQGLRRTLTKDTELAGTSLKQGDWILALNGSGNRDEQKFPDAEKCLLDRTPNPHIGFGAGAHICLGRNLARLEIEVLIKAVLERMYDYRVADDFVPEYLVGEARGMVALPVTFTPVSAR